MWAVACRVFCRSAIVAPEASVKLLQSLYWIEIAPKAWAVERCVAAFAPLARLVIVSSCLVVVVFADLLLLLRDSVSYGRVVLYCLVPYFVYSDREIGGFTLYAVEIRLPAFVVEVVAAVVVCVVGSRAAVVVVAVGVAVGVVVGVGVVWACTH